MSGSEVIVTCVSDDSRVRAGRLGLVNLRHRAALIGGTLDITSAPGQGCRIHFYTEIKHNHDADKVTGR